MTKILLVEDDNNLREIYSARLSAEGYKIATASDGEEALAVAVKERPDLIIADVMMPKVSGFDMLDILRNAPETKNTKVIMMTALSQAEDKERASKLGADLYLVKSQVTLEDVTKAVHNILEGPGQPTESAPPAATSAAAPAAMPDQPVAEPEPPVTPSEQTATPVTAAAPPAQDDNSDDLKKKIVEPAQQPALAVVTPKPLESTPATEPQKPADSNPTTLPSPSVPAVQATEDSNIGPNLAQALAEEEQLNGQAGTSTSEPVEVKVSTATPEPPKDEPKSVLSNESKGGERVIQPTEEFLKGGPNIQELLAKEEANAAVTTPAPDTVVTPEPPKEDQKKDEQAKSGDDSRPEDHDKFGKIAI